MMQINKKLIVMLVALLGMLGFTPAGSDMAGFATRGFRTLAPNTATSTDVTYDFGVVDIPTGRVGVASGSADPSGYEFGRMLTTSATAFTVASTSTGFAFTVQKSGRVKGCSFELQVLPTTGTVSIMIQQNGILIATKYCKLPNSGTFAVNGGPKDVSITQTFLSDNITFVAGDRFGLIASSSGLNAATIDGSAKLILQLNN